ncbi:hypothetical protein BNJ_00441 [Kaumoebavirus]|uniref:hypothetical protein n=1 Tax=Kaumoebavirus TaxID=1859492 RepID=UPI0009C1C910|nr:hypothetical protein BNJ_00441 [Kaumoebavirus]ARA72253.1 hypothetical protein BNJ_00441 [Kaumoebavirus]
MQARKIVDEDLVSALDEILPREITDIVLSYYLEQSKRISRMFNVIEDCDWITDPYGFGHGVGFLLPVFRHCVAYTCGVEKEVDRCKECLAVRTVKWTYYMENGKPKNPWEQLWEFNTVYSYDCEESGHSEKMMGDRINTLIGIDWVKLDGVFYSGDYEN